MTETEFFISKLYVSAFFYPKTLAAAFGALVLLSVFLYSRLLRTKKRLDRTKDALHVCEETLEALPDGYYLWMYDSVGFMSKTYCSRRLAVMMGLSGGYEAGFDAVCEHFTPRDAERLADALSEMRRNGEPFYLELKNVSETAEYSICGFRQTAEGETPLLDIIWVRDVTQDEVFRRNLTAECGNLKRRTHFFEQSFDALPFPVWIRDEDLQIVLCNSAYADIVNAPSKEQAVLAGTEPVYEKSPREARILAAAARASGKGHKSDEFIVTDGRRKRMEVAEIPLPPDGDSFRGRTLGFMRDVTEEQDLKDELKNHIDSHNGVLEHLKTAIAVFNGDMRLQFYNTSFLQLWDLEEEWLDGSPSYSNFLDVLREKRKLPENRDFRAYKNQELRYFSTLVAAKEDIMHLPSGITLRRMLTPHPLGGLLITYEDVTGHLSMERSMTVLNETQYTLINRMREGVLVFGGDGRLKLANKAYAALWNFPRSDYKKPMPSIAEVIEDQKKFFENSGEWDSLKEQLLGVVTSHTGEFFQILRPDGKTIEFSAVALPDGGVFVSFFDVSEAETNSSLLLQKENLLSRLKQTTVQADALRSSFIKDLKTEMCAPLSILNETAETLLADKNQPLSKERKNALRTIKKSSNTLKSLLDDMTDLALVEAGSNVLELTSVDVPALIGAAANALKERLKSRGVVLETECEENLPPLSADKKRLKQTLYYLLDNALNSAYKKGVISLRAARESDEDGQWLVIRIAVSALNLDDGRQKSGFSPNAGFAGSLIRNLIEMHGGKLVLADGNGSKETEIHLPLR